MENNPVAKNNQIFIGEKESVWMNYHKLRVQRLMCNKEVPCCVLMFPLICLWLSHCKFNDWF